MDKAPDAFRTISEVSEWLDTPTYVLRFWESRFPQIKPVKRAGGRRYYRPDDMMLLGGIKKLLHFDDMTIKSVKKLLKDKGAKHVMDLSPDLNTQVVSPQTKGDDAEKAAIAEMVKATDDTRKAKPKVEVRVVKKGKLAEQPEAEDAVAPQVETPNTEAVADPVALDSVDKPDETVTAETVSESAATEDIVAEEPAAEESDVDAEKASAKAEKKAKKKAKAEKKAEREPMDAMALAKAEEADRQEAAKAAAAAKTIADEEAEDWGELEADIVRNVPYAIQPASAYDAETMGKIETLYYSLRMVRNSMKRAKDREEDTAA